MRLRMGHNMSCSTGILERKFMPLRKVPVVVLLSLPSPLTDHLLLASSRPTYPL